MSLVWIKHFTGSEIHNRENVEYTSGCFKLISPVSADQPITMQLGIDRFSHRLLARYRDAVVSDCKLTLRCISARFHYL